MENQPKAQEPAAGSCCGPACGPETCGPTFGQRLIRIFTRSK